MKCPSGNVFWHVTHVNRNRGLPCVHRSYPEHCHIPDKMLTSTPTTHLTHVTWHMSPDTCHLTHVTWPFDQCNNTNHSPDEWADHHVPLTWQWCWLWHPFTWPMCWPPTHLINVLNIIQPPDKCWQWPFSYSPDRQSTTHSPDKCNDHTAYSPDECCRWQPPRVGGCQGEPGDHPRPTPAQHTRDNPCSRGAGPGDRHRYWDNLWVK